MSDASDYEDDFEPEDDSEEECGRLPDGTCMLIGTEHCDWDCGRLAAERIEAMKEATPETTQ